MKEFYFPFGQKLSKVQQKDISGDKHVFVLGVYASAIHAKWIGADNKVKVRALAVASEPEIFWKGEDAEQKIKLIKIPHELGRLELPTDKSLNGPSGNALDNLFLAPLGYKRKQAWLCDLLPESRVNMSQKKALNKFYTKEIVEKYNFPTPAIPDFDEKEIERHSEKRKLEILSELEASGAKTLVLLGDHPIRWFLNLFDNKYSKLSQFGTTNETYGKKHEIKINNKLYSVIPLCHPRNASKLGTYSKQWFDLHEYWVKNLNSTDLYQNIINVD
jgi:hypothetical protein